MCSDNNDEASTSRVSSDDPNQTFISYEYLSEGIRAVISKEEFIRMTSVKVVAEQLPSLPNNASDED